MEFPSAGQQCSHTLCKQLDFLPLHCQCGKLFCSEHFNLHVLNCQFDRIESEARSIQNLYHCSFDGCFETFIIPITCERCKQHFCIKHRHMERCEEKTTEVLAQERELYAAPKRQFEQAKTKVDEQIERGLAQAHATGKHNLANKIQLMKIKGKAKGLKTIPTSDRIYFNVSYKTQLVPVFVSQVWTLGRAIDAIANECNLRNDNNLSSSKKLRLFKKVTGQAISNDMSSNLADLIMTGIVANGENLIIEYVDSDQNKI